MAVFPKCEHLKISMICCSLLGIFPWQFMFQGNEGFQRAYALYSNLMLGYYIGFLVTAYIELYFILNVEDVRMDALSANMCITLIYTATIIRQLIIKLNPGFKRIVKKIIDGEEKISNLKDKEVVQIYYDCAMDTKQKTKLYLYILCAITMQYIVRPALVKPIQMQVANKTMIIKPLPLSSWFPFDKQVHYIAAYIWQIFDSLIGASFVTYTDIFMFNLIVYPVGQLKMLHHRLKNFETYKWQYKVLNGLVDDNMAGCITFVDFVKKHREIIDYIEFFNESMGTLMVFDFLQSSLQIACILTQVLGNKITLVMFFFVGTFFVGMILRLILYYYYANDVTVLSQRLAFAVWESNWYEQPPDVKYMMFMFIMRTQKPLKLRIGSFSEMSLNSFFAILKTTYSYIMLMYGIN